MKPCKLFLILVTALSGLTLGSASARGGVIHPGDIFVARSSGGQLRVSNLRSVVFLNPVSGILDGWTAGDPGFLALEEADPGNDLHLLQTGAQVRIELIAISPAFKVWGPGLTGPLDTPGESFLLGGPDLHEHFTWHIDSEDAGFDPGDVTWQATFKLVDTGSTAYSESEPFVMTFARAGVPAASAWGLAVMGLMIATMGTIALRRFEV
jgi:hypothetical protein